MTTDLSQYNANELPNADVLARQRYAIVVADWNSEITHKLAQGAIDTLIKHGVKEENIDITHVPGTVELTYGASLYVSGYKACEGTFFRKPVNAVIVIGCVIKVIRLTSTMCASQLRKGLRFLTHKAQRGQDKV